MIRGGNGESIPQGETKGNLPKGAHTQLHATTTHKQHTITHN